MNDLFAIVNIDSRTEVVYGTTPCAAWNAFNSMGFTKGIFECVLIKN